MSEDVRQEVCAQSIKHSMSRIGALFAQSQSPHAFLKHTEPRLTRRGERTARVMRLRLYSLGLFRLGHHHRSLYGASNRQRWVDVDDAHDRRALEYTPYFLCVPCRRACTARCQMGGGRGIRIGGTRKGLPECAAEALHECLGGHRRKRRVLRRWHLRQRRCGRIGVVRLAAEEGGEWWCSGGCRAHGLCR